MNSFRKCVLQATVVCFLATVTTAYALRPDAPAISKENRAAIDAISPNTIRRHLQTLADDKMEGRDAGSKGYLMAANYAADEFKRAGAKPGGDNGTYFQDVPSVSISPDPASTLVIVSEGKQSQLRFGADFSAGTSINAPDPLAAPLVFAGYGVSNPDAKWDDYASLDVKDKIAVVLSGAPPGTPDSARFRSASTFGKARAARLKGAKGLIILAPANEMSSPRPSIMLKTRPVESGRNRDSSTTITVNRASAGPLFAGSGKTLQDAVSAAEKAGAGFELKSTVKLDIKPAIVADTPNPNVIAYVPGTDPRLKDEVVIYTAHLDHVGVGAPVNGDAIYNGALDNASGSSVLLALAETFARLPGGPRRTMVFLLVTGEEKGFWGSGHYVRNPKWPLSKTAANINIDMIMGWKPSKSIVASGSEKSTLKQVVTETAGWMEMSVAQDPFPNERFFYRSDQIVFARAGVPALFLQPGPHWEGMTEEEATKILKEWMSTRYHRVGDEIQPDWDFRAFQRIAQVAFLLGQRINETDSMPTWNPGDEFEAKRKESLEKGN